MRLMFFIHLWVIDSKGCIPDIWIRDRIKLWHQSFESKVCVFDVLSQPIFDEFSDLLGNWNMSSFDGFHQTKMSASVISNVMLIIKDLSVQVFFIAEMFIIELVQFMPNFFTTRICFHFSNNIKKSNMFIIHLLNIHREGRVPDIWIRNRIMLPQGKLSSISMISVLDVLCQPVLCPINCA